MEITKNDMKILKGVAIIFMLLLHLFARKEINGLYETYIWIDNVPLLYYLALFGDACVPIFCFASGYGLYVSYQKTNKVDALKNFRKILKLLINFWIILLLFVTIGFLFGESEKYPGSTSRFLLNFFLLSNSYNGAWWFMQTYVLLILMAPVIFKAVKNYNSIVVLFVTGVIYLLSYIQRFKGVLDLGDNAAIITLVNATVLFGTSLLPFVVGSLFMKESIYSKVYTATAKLKHKNMIFSLGILLLFVIHSLYESLIIAPFTAISFICLFNLMDKNKIIENVLAYLGNHSTNLWLTHMFFYATIFRELTFAPKYPFLILLWLITLCLLSSYIINSIYKPIVNLVDNKKPPSDFTEKVANDI